LLPEVRIRNPRSRVPKNCAVQGAMDGTNPSHCQAQSLPADGCSGHGCTNHHLPFPGLPSLSPCVPPPQEASTVSYDLNVHLGKCNLITWRLNVHIAGYLPAMDWSGLSVVARLVPEHHCYACNMCSEPREQLFTWMQDSLGASCPCMQHEHSEALGCAGQLNLPSHMRELNRSS
jgi:hypothetical protein